MWLYLFPVIYFSFISFNFPACIRVVQCCMFVIIVLVTFAVIEQKFIKLQCKCTCTAGRAQIDQWVYSKVDIYSWYIIVIQIKYVHACIYCDPSLVHQPLFPHRNGWHARLLWPHAMAYACMNMPTSHTSALKHAVIQKYIYRSIA